MAERIASLIRNGIIVASLNMLGCGVAAPPSPTATASITPNDTESECSKQGKIESKNPVEERTVPTGWTSRLYSKEEANINQAGTFSIAVEPNYLTQQRPFLVERFTIPGFTVGAAFKIERLNDLYVGGGIGSLIDQPAYTWNVTLLDVNLSQCHVLRADWKDGALEGVIFDATTLPIHRNPIHD